MKIQGKNTEIKYRKFSQILLSFLWPPGGHKAPVWRHLVKIYASIYLFFMSFFLLYQCDIHYAEFITTASNVDATDIDNIVWTNGWDYITCSMSADSQIEFRNQMGFVCTIHTTQSITQRENKAPALHNTPFISFKVMSHSKSSFVHKTQCTIHKIQTKRADGSLEWNWSMRKRSSGQTDEGLQLQRSCQSDKGSASSCKSLACFWRIFPPFSFFSPSLSHTHSYSHFLHYSVKLKLSPVSLPALLHCVNKGCLAFDPATQAKVMKEVDWPAHTQKYTLTNNPVNKYDLWFKCSRIVTHTETSQLFNSCNPHPYQSHVIVGATPFNTGKITNSLAK